MELSTTLIGFLELKCKRSCDALDRLHEAITDYEQVLNSPTANLFIDISMQDQKERMIRTYRNSAIKLFELTFDTVCKYLEEYFLSIHGVNLNYPKDVFKECHRAGLLSEEQTKQALSMVDDRNKSVHMYSEALANRIYASVPTYYHLMKQLMDPINILVKPSLIS